MDVNSDMNGSAGFSGTTHDTRDSGHDTRDSYWQSRVNRPVKEILSQADADTLAADVDFQSLPPLAGIERALQAYRANGDPDALVLIATCARKEFTHPTAGHAGNATGGSYDGREDAGRSRR